MKINPVNKIAIVNELTNVETQAVSLVNYGANEQGFKIVKTLDEKLDEYNLNSKRLFDNKGDFLMAVNPKRIEFDVNVFPTMEKVEEYLKGYNYEDVSIVEKSGLFIAHSSDNELDLETGEPIIMEDGVTAYLIETEDDEDQAVEKSEATEETVSEVVAENVKDEASDTDTQETEKDATVVKETETAIEEVEVVAEDLVEEVTKSQETAEVQEVSERRITFVQKSENVPTQEIKKFDYWASYEDKDGDFLKSVRSGLDKGLPPSFEYVSELFTKSQVQAIVKGDRGLYDKNCGDYLKYMTAMLQVFTDVVAMPEATMATVIEMEKSEENPSEAQGQVDKYDEVFKRLAELEAKIGLVQAEKAEVEAELEKSKEELAEVLNKSKEIEKQLDAQESVEETIQKRKVIGRVAGVPTRSPKMPIFAMGEHGTLRPL